MKKLKIRLILLVCGLVALGSVLLIAQAKKNKKNAGEAQATAAPSTPKPASKVHPFGPTHIHINFDACEVQEPVVHADISGQVIFHNELSSSDANIKVTDGFLQDPKFTVPAHATKMEKVIAVPPTGMTVLGTYTITNCTKTHYKGKHLPFTTDPNDILVP